MEIINSGKGVRLISGTQVVDLSYDEYYSLKAQIQKGEFKTEELSLKDRTTAVRLKDETTVVAVEELEGVMYQRLSAEGKVLETTTFSGGLFEPLPSNEFRGSLRESGLLDPLKYEAWKARMFRSIYGASSPRKG
jgi:hypothetical protein